MSDYRGTRDYHLRQLVKLVLNRGGTSRRAAVRSYQFDLLSRLAPCVAIEADGLWYFVHAAEGMGRDMFITGQFEDRTTMRAVLDVLEQQTGAPPLAGRTFVDVGANIGTSTLLALTEHGAARAEVFEPEAANLRLLRCNLAANGLDGRATVHAVALSDTTGTGTLEICEENPGDHRLRLGPVAPGSFRETTRPTIPIPTTTFDRLVDEGALDLGDVGMVWMDTQGHEGHVFGGAKSLLASDVPSGDRILALRTAARQRPGAAPRGRCLPLPVDREHRGDIAGGPSSDAPGDRCRSTG